MREMSETISSSKLREELKKAYLNLVEEDNSIFIQVRDLLESLNKNILEEVDKTELYKMILGTFNKFYNDPEDPDNDIIYLEPEFPDEKAKQEFNTLIKILRDAFIRSSNARYSFDFDLLECATKIVESLLMD